MTNSESLFERSLLVTSFLGGITFAAMILLMQDQKSFAVTSSLLGHIPYSRLLILATAFTSILFIIASVGLIRLGVGEIKSDQVFSRFIGGVATSGYIALMSLMPALMVPFSRLGALTIFIIELVLMLIFFITYRSSSK